jgi:hypothetical protein
VRPSEPLGHEGGWLAA